MSLLPGLEKDVGDHHVNNSLPSTSRQPQRKQQQRQQQQLSHELDETSSHRIAVTATTLIPQKKNKPEESDEDLFRVPDLEEAGAQPAESTIINNNSIGDNDNMNSIINPNNYNPAEVQPARKRRRGRNPVDKEHRRLKRLLRNRVSAQQARERKKVYVDDLESRAKELQDKNCEIEEKILILINENAMLRKVLMNTGPKVDEISADPELD